MSNALWNMAYAHLQAENATLKAKVESLEDAASGWMERAEENEKRAQEWEKSYLIAKGDLAGERQRVESLEADFRRVQANNLKMRDAIEEYEAEAKALRAKLRALEGAAREVVDNSTLGTVATEYAHPLGATMSQVPAKLMTALEKVLEGAGFHPTKGEEEERRAEDFGDDGLGDYQG